MKSARDVYKIKVALSLTVKEWQEVLAGLTNQTFCGRKQADRLRQKIALCVQDTIERKG